MITITREKDNGVLSGRLNGDVFALAREMPGRKRWKGRQLYFELTRANIEFIKEHFPEATWAEDTSELLDKWQDIKARADQTILDKRRDFDLPSFDYKTKPFAHQEKAFFLARDQEAFGLFMEMGTGKTKVEVDDLAYNYAAGTINCALIIAPNGVHHQWVAEQIPIHMPDWCPYTAVAYVSPSNQRVAWKKEYATMMEETGKLRILAMHAEALSSKAGVEAAIAFLQSGRAAGVVDESTRFKTPGSARTKNLMKLRDYMVIRRILSGAPITKGVEDLFPQLKFLDPDILGFNSFYTFRNHFCVTQPIPGAPAGAVKIAGYKNLDTLQTRLDGHTFRVTKAECLDLPEVTYMTEEVEMTKEQKKAYYDLRDDLLTQLEDGTLVEAPMAITKLMKMQQVLCGFLQPEEGPWVELPNNRVDRAVNLAQDAQDKVLIWGRYHADLQRLSRALKNAGIRAVEYHGEVSREQRIENKQLFIEDDAVRVFLGQAQAAGTGTDGLQKVSSTAVYFSNDFNADTRWQSEARLHRSGQTRPVTIIDLIVPNSIDTRILKALLAKKNVADSVLDVRELLTAL